jgi:hypothetical protein
MAAAQEAAAAPYSPTTGVTHLERLRALCYLISLLTMILNRIGVFRDPVPFISLDNAAIMILNTLVSTAVDACTDKSAAVSTPMILELYIQYLAAVLAMQAGSRSS